MLSVIVGAPQPSHGACTEALELLRNSTADSSQRELQRAKVALLLKTEFDQGQQAYRDHGRQRLQEADLADWLAELLQQVDHLSAEEDLLRRVLEHWAELLGPETLEGKLTGREEPTLADPPPPISGD